MPLSTEVVISGIAWKPSNNLASGNISGCPFISHPSLFLWSLGITWFISNKGGWTLPSNPVCSGLVHSVTLSPDAVTVQHKAALKLLFLPVTTFIYNYMTVPVSSQQHRNTDIASRGSVLHFLHGRTKCGKSVPPTSISFTALTGLVGSIIFYFVIYFMALSVSHTI
jgi:hypothetical protein